MRNGSASRVCPANTTFHRPLFRGCSYSFMFRPPSLLASRVVPTAAGSPCRAAEAFTSELNVHRCLCTHRICYPPDYRQLAERGLTPRKIHSIVDCSSHFWGSLQVLRSVPMPPRDRRKPLLDKASMAFGHTW